MSSAMRLDHPGQRLKLPDGPSVDPRRLSEHCLRIADIGCRIFIFVIAFSCCLGQKNATKYGRTPPYFKTHLTNIEM